MSIFLSYKKIFLLGFILVILVAIPFTVYVAQKRQQIVSIAAKSTTLSFEPASVTTKVNDILTLDIILDPGVGSTANQVSFVKVTISFDPLKFATVSGSIEQNPNSPNTLTSILEKPVYSVGKASISLSIGADPTKVVTTKTKIATLKLKALSVASSPSKIEFVSAPNTQVLSIAASDQTSENVLSTTIPATITINSQSSSSQTPTPIVVASAITAVNPTSAPTPLPGRGSFPTSKLTSTSTGSAFITPTFIAEPLSTQVILPPTGPQDSILGIGILGGLLMLIGGALFIFL